MAGLETIAGRFQLGERAGAGGMGVVRRGIDLVTQEPVAVKLLHPGLGPERFVREAEVLATLNHPAIVRHVAHGETDGGRFYLVMEWLEGSTLEDLLRARRLISPADAVTLARRLASGLSAAHRGGVVHRDIKPSNVLLVGDGLERATLIDFGVARRTFDLGLTAAGLLVGTVAYMSPEQALGQSDVTPASDVFSVGTLLYRALSGVHPFLTGDVSTTLARVVLDDPPPLSDVAPAVPRSLDTLVLSMLAKDSNARPADGTALVSALDSMGAPSSPAVGDPVRAFVGSEERRVVWLVLIGGGTLTDDGALTSRGRDDLESAARVAKRHGARWDLLADGSGVVTFADPGGDRGARAVHLARELCAVDPTRPMALALGLGVVGLRAPFGQALERAAASLAVAAPGEIHVDGETARALDKSVLGVGRDGRHRLVRTEIRFEEQRRLLGRATPCVGRKRELDQLERSYDECARDSVARVVLVVGPTGIGKSRLRYELLERLRQRGERFSSLLGRGDSLSAGSPFAPLRAALRRSAKILDGEPLGDSRQKLNGRVRRVLGGGSRAFDVSVFLGELAHVPFDDADSDALRAARNDPASMGDAIRRAWLDFIAAECSEQPVVIVLEDLHWGDRPTLSLLDAALSNASERPLFVLALARPEIEQVFPGLWSERELSLIRLGPLPQRAAVALVHEVLGADLDPALERRLVDLAAGNAFFLEELIRAVAEGRTHLPPTVMGIVQARLDQLAPDARRALRVASVFGEKFWKGGVEALLASTGEPSVPIADTLEDLVLRELVTRRTEASIPGETELVFRHSIVRETAYAALTEPDRALAHRMAGAWLERVGETDALTLAEHFRRGEAPDRAAPHYLTAAEHALDGQDLASAVEHAKLALRGDPDDAVRGPLAQVLGHALLWKGEYADAQRWSSEAIELLEPGSPRWFSALSEACSSAGALDREEAVTRAAQLASDATAATDDARAAQVMCLARAATAHLRHGRREAALALIERMTAIGREATTLTATIDAWTHHGRASLAYFTGDSSGFRRALEAAMVCFDAAGDTRSATNERVNLGFALASVGAYQRAEALIAPAAAEAERSGLAKVTSYAWNNLGWIRMQLGDCEQAIELQRRAVAVARAQNESFLEGSARAHLALALSGLGRDAEAEPEARRAVELLEPAPALRPHALAALARVLVGLGRLDEAQAMADDALRSADTRELPEDSDALVRLVAAETLRAAGHDAAARAAIGGAHERIQARAARIDDPDLRLSFLEAVPENARTIELFHAWRER